MRAFREQVEMACEDPQTRLTHLEQLCIGKVKESLAPYLYSNAPDAYDRAIKELRDTYGDTDALVHEWVERLLKTPNSFEQYAINLRTCCAVIEAVGKTQEVVSRIDLGKIARMMPEKYHFLWSFEALRIHDEEGRTAGLRDLAHAVDRYQRQHRQKIHGDVTTQNNATTKPPKAPAGRHQQAPVTRYSPRRQDMNTMTPTTEDHANCTVCEQQDHALRNCETFLGWSLDKRRIHVSRNRLCFLCLQPGHIAIKCESKKECQAEGCGRRHATPLHDPQWRGRPSSGGSDP
jgi:hypothetical protein